MIDFKKAIREGLPPTQDEIDAERLEAEKKLSEFKQKIYWSLGLVLSIPLFLIIATKNVDAAIAVAAILVFLVIVLTKEEEGLGKLLSLYTEYNGAANLSALKKMHICGKVYFKALGEMGRAITKGEVEAMESQIKGISLSELKKKIYR